MINLTKRGKLVIFAALVVTASVISFVAIPVSIADSGGTAFEMQLVLGGNSRKRSEISVALWRELQTPILVSGDGGAIMESLIELKVPESEIIHEIEARSTWENAVNSVKIMRAREVRSVVIVTSAYHSARALACFRKVAPEIQFGTRTQPARKRSGWEVFHLSFHERCKRLGYGVTHGLNPWSSGR
jgi:uncharacterized SAM-binding protein YcdF (DUF218 family)